MPDEDSLSEGDAIFTDSEGERLDYSGSSSTSNEEDEEFKRPSKRRVKVTSLL